MLILDMINWVIGHAMMGKRTDVGSAQLATAAYPVKSVRYLCALHLKETVFVTSIHSRIAYYNSAFRVLISNI